MMRPMVTSAKIKNIFIGAPKLKQMLCRNPAKSFVPYCKHVTAILLILFEPKLPESVKGFDIPESRVSRKCLAYSPLPAIWLDCKGFRRFQVSLRRAECCEPLEPGGNIVLLHDNEPNDLHRKVDRTSTDGGAAFGATTSQRA